MNFIVFRNDFLYNYLYFVQELKNISTQNVNTLYFCRILSNLKFFFFSECSMKPKLYAFH